MTCYYPLHGFKGPVNENGKRPIIWKAPKGTEEQDVPCGQCIGCRLERSRQWALRCVNEASMWKENSFVTLTYDDANLPKSGSLVLEDYQLFMKRLRQKRFRDKMDSVGSWNKEKDAIRFFHCGEYGEETARPHYHSILFNCAFDDKTLYKVDNGNRLYNSQELSDLWGKGHAVIGDVTFESAAYVARYVLKKRTNKENVVDRRGNIILSKDEYYANKRTGEIRTAEYVTMSRRPGIGRSWYDVYNQDLYPSDQYIGRGIRMKPPKYYDNILDKENPQMHDLVKEKRLLTGKRWSKEIVDGKPLYIDEYGPDRLAVKALVQEERQEIMLRNKV